MARILGEIRQKAWTFVPTDAVRKAIRAEYGRLRQEDPELLVTRTNCITSLILRGAGSGGDIDESEAPGDAGASGHDSAVV